MFMHNLCSCNINIKVTNLHNFVILVHSNILMYDIYLHTIYVDKHLKTILAVKF